MPRLNLAAHQELPRGWKWGAHRRDGTWWLVGPNGRCVVVELDERRTPAAPRHVRVELMRASEPDRTRQVRR